MKKLSFIAFSFLFAAFSAQGSEVQVKGKVTDQETGQILKNCHVYINPHFGTITNEDGVFDLAIPEKYSQQFLRISFLGYETFEVPVKDLKNEFMEVELRFGATALDDVVVVRPDPWDDFRFIISEISANYDNRRDLYAAVLDELEKVELPEENETQIARDVEYKGENFEGGLLHGIVAFCITALALAIFTKPVLKMIEKSSK